MAIRDSHRPKVDSYDLNRLRLFVKLCGNSYEMV